MKEWLDIGMANWRADSEILEAIANARRRLTPAGADSAYQRS
jgi:hypothetical protein